MLSSLPLPLGFNHASVSHLLGSWLGGFSLKFRKQMLVGVAALCWALWLNRNDAVFNRKLPKSYFQVFFRGTYWTRFWLQLSKEEEKDLLENVCRQLEGRVLELFARRGWNFINRLVC